MPNPQSCALGARWLKKRSKNSLLPIYQRALWEKAKGAEWLYHSHAVILTCPPPHPFPRPVRYLTQSLSLWLPRRNNRPFPARCHTGTSSKPASLGRWTYLCPSATCSSVFSHGPRVQLLRGVCPPPSGRTSPGRVCRCLGNRTLRVGPAAGG